MFLRMLAVSAVLKILSIAIKWCMTHLTSKPSNVTV